MVAGHQRKGGKKMSFAQAQGLEMRHVFSLKIYFRGQGKSPFPWLQSKMKVFLYHWWLILSKLQLVGFHDIHYGQDLNLQESLRTYQKRERKKETKHWFGGTPYLVLRNKWLPWKIASPRVGGNGILWSLLSRGTILPNPLATSVTCVGVCGSSSLQVRAGPCYPSGKSLWISSRANS